MGTAIRLEDFLYVARIGKGQFGKVDAVRYTGDGKVYALKTIEKAKISRVGQALDVELEKDVLLQACSARSRDGSPWSPVPELFATIASHSTLHIVFSFANCGTLWDLFCSTQSAPVEESRNCFDEQWLERNEGGNGTLFGGGSFLHSIKAESLFESVAGTSVSVNTKRLNESTLVFYAKQLVLAIQWLHEEAGVVHRDIKPENVLLMDDGRAVVCDFGSAARLVKEHTSPTAVENEAVPSTQHTSCHQGDGPWLRPRYLSLSVCETLHGTADYIAPEVLQTYEQVLLDSDDSILAHRQDLDSSDGDQSRGYDASVDWWSFGAMCYELITGMPPFYARTIEETYCKIVSCQSPQRPNGSICSDVFAEFLASLLVPAPERLGRLGPEEVKQHALFRSVDWEMVRNNDVSLRSGVSQSPRRLELPTKPFVGHYAFEGSFGSEDLEKPSWLHEHSGTPAGNDFSWNGHQPSAMSLVVGENDRDFHIRTDPDGHEKWAHWEWVSPNVNPPTKSADKHPRLPIPVEPSVRTGPRLPIIDRLKHHATPNRGNYSPAAEIPQTTGPGIPAFRPASANRFMTPASDDVDNAARVRELNAPLSICRTMPRTVARGDGQKMTVMSESKALRLMVKCVQRSARKKNLASQRKKRPTMTSNSYQNAGYSRRATETEDTSVDSSSSPPRQPKSFISRLKAIKLQDQPRSVTRLCHAVSGNTSEGDSLSQLPPFDLHRTKSVSSNRKGETSSAVLKFGGFDAFVADLAMGHETADFESSPRASCTSSASSYTARSLRDATDGRDALSQDDSPPSLNRQISGQGSTRENPPMSEGTQVIVPVIAPVPRHLGVEEILSRLFPGYSTETPSAAQTSSSGGTFRDVSTASSSGALRDDSRHQRETDEPVELDSGTLFQASPEGIAFQDATESSEGISSEESIEEISFEETIEGPTRRIEGLMGQHQRMERNLEHLEMVTRRVKERLEHRAGQFA